VEQTKTICQMCYFYCGLDVYHERGRVVRIEGNRDHPANRGTLCPKGLAARHLPSDSRRLTRPLRRVGERGGGQWKPIGWDEAIHLLAERVTDACAQDGPESVVFHRGQAPGWVTAMNYATRFMNTLGSPNLVTHSHLCFQPRAIAHLSTYGGVPEPDFDAAKCILLWGFNPVHTALPNYGRRIMEARARGAKLIVVDPRFSNTAAKADLWLRPYPGSDLALALGMAKVLVDDRLIDVDFVKESTSGFDALVEHLNGVEPSRVEQETGIHYRRIADAAHLFAENLPAVLKEGNGLDQHVNVVQSVRAVALLSCLTGNLNVKGGNVFVPALPFKDVQRRSVLPGNWEQKSISRHPLYFRQGNALHDADLMECLETGQPNRIRCLIVQGGDPLAANSETERTRRLLNRMDFIAVHDLYRTSCASVADLVLPAASFLERDLLLYYRYRPSAYMNLVALQQQVVKPVGESRSDIDFIFALAQALGMIDAFPWERAMDAFDWELSPLEVTTEKLRDLPEGLARWYEPQELFRTHGRTGFSTESTKVDLYSTRLERFGHAPLPMLTPTPAEIECSEEYPLLCGTGLKLGIHTHTQFHTLPGIREIEPERFVEIHPNQARRMSVHDGDRVRITSPWGSVGAVARLREGSAEDVAMLSYGYGQDYAQSEWRSSNDMTSHKPSDPISGATSNRRVPCRLSVEAEAAGEIGVRRAALVLDLDRCVGCFTCELACEQLYGRKRLAVQELGPHENSLDKVRSVFVVLGSEECQLCRQRLADGTAPACVAACPTTALSIQLGSQVVGERAVARRQICAVSAINEPTANRLLKGH
jgi:anaerobic selenocysteine-containing dehydrogenase/Fe-S-cluster-containing dehydrogenase component